jgi:3-oxoacyl-[acyl-carrier protein] reductase
MQAQPLSGKIAMVTGAGSPIGLGRAMTLALVRAGARVAMVDVNDKWLQETANDVREVGGDECALTLTADVSNADDAERAVNRAISELGGLHILVNNAGISPRGLVTSPESPDKFWDVSPDVWDKVISVNLGGPFYMARAVVGHMLAQSWGRIIGVTTSLDTMWRRGGSPYGPSKAGHEALIAIAAQELEGTGVTANVLVPGGVANTNILPLETEYDRNAIIQPEVMQAPVVWLASDESREVNGRRFIAYHWDESLPLEERLEQSSAPAAWPQLGRQSIRPD